MQFNSFQFLYFFITVSTTYFLLPHRYRWLLLLLASCVFYCAFIPQYILILFFTIVVDYTAGLFIEHANGSRRRLYLIASMAANIGTLAIFKYFDFLIRNTNMLLHIMHLPVQPLPFLNIILPIGLSFHTFQAMSYTIEVYRGNQKAEKHFGIYALYVMFYPQLVAGPIERPQNLLHQFREKHTPDYGKILSGLRQMLWGLFKKAVIADRLAQYINPVFHRPDDYHALSLIIAMVFFAYQVYFDFSGYSDIALGAARVMGFTLMRNFNHPFQSRNVTEFWRRWHISLSTWFNDYVFTPFVMARRDGGKIAVVTGLFITFFLSGIWHGAGWTFVVFGILHGLAVIYEFVTKKWRTRFSKKIPALIYNPLSRIITFLFLIVAWVFFRSPDLHFAIAFLNRLINPDTNYFLLNHVIGFGWFSFAVVVLSIIAVLVFERFIDPELNKLNNKPYWDLAFCIAALFIMVTLGNFNQQTFIYFQF